MTTLTPPQPALTSRGFMEKDFEKVAEFLDRVVKICLEVQQSAGKLLTKFLPALEQNEELKVRGSGAGAGRIC